MLFAVNDNNKNRIAILDENNIHYTYGELQKKADFFIKIIPPRSLVLIRCYRDIETIAFYFCMMLNHVVPIMLAPDLDEGLFYNLVEIYKPQYIWDKVREIESQDMVYSAQEHVLYKTGEQSPLLNDSLALLLSTSGSTGSPKLVRLSYDNIISNVEACKNIVEYTENDIGVTTLPISFCFGLSTLHCHWRAGGKVLVTERTMLDPRYWTELKKWSVTNIEVVPYHFEIMRRLEILETGGLSLRFIMSGGAKLDDKNAEFAYKLYDTKKIHFYVFYGQTEVTTFVTIINDAMLIQKTDSVGKTIAGLKAECRGENEKELVVMGASVSLGYAKGWEDLSLGDVNQGMIHTGDYAEMDEEGYIYLKGRKSRFIKILGIRYSLDEIENLLKSHFNNSDIICTGIDDLLKIFIVGNSDERAVRIFCEKKFSIHRNMIEVELIEEIPRGNNGKVLYSKVGLK